jgi:four helix bundle protein
MTPVRSHRELKLYRATFALQQEVFHVTQSFPREERYALVAQFRRSSRAIGANVAEAWQKRRYRGHFISKLTDADAELAETKHWLDTARACGYLSSEASTGLDERSLEVGGMLGAMLRGAFKWSR